MSPTLGLFGKMPAVGDFVHRGFSRELQGALDRLFQTALQTAHSEGATRESLERSAHSFTLHVRPGALCSSGFLGCVVQSCDRVGRFFPLCVGLEVLPGPLGALRSPLAWVSLALAVEVCRTTYAAQAAAVGPDELMLQLPDVPVWTEFMASNLPFDATLETTVPLVPTTTTQFAFAGPEGAMHPLDKATCSRLPMMSEALGAVITQGTQFDVFFATRSLLSWSALAALFDGRWEHWGWALQRLSTAVEQDDDTVIPPHDDGVE